MTTIYVLNQNGKPLMPTKDCRKVRLLLRDKTAKVVQRTPFTIQLLHSVKEYKQDITLGVDAGSKFVGLSATTEKEELFVSEATLRNDVTLNLADRKMYRRNRRSRLRYRKPRFQNRVKSKKEGWLAPSIRHKIDSHVKLVDNVYKILPITKLNVEVAQFDIQKINNPDIEGKEYQQGDQLGFWNVREYVLYRDNHTCQYCKGKSKDNTLNIHHLESRKTGGDAPNNLITLCETCHKDYHNGKTKLTIKRGRSFRDASHMGIMRWSLLDRLKEQFRNVNITYGYITKNTRIKNGIEKSHINDAYCIANNINATRAGEMYKQVFKRKRNRQIHKATIYKDGVKRLNQAPYKVFGFRLFDKVKYDDKEYFIFGRRTKGGFDIRDLNGNKINNGNIGYKKLQFLEHRKSLLLERRGVIHPLP